MEADVTWIYFEIPTKKLPKGYKLVNAVLTEVYDDQVNLVNLHYQNQKRSFIFKRGNTSAELALN